MGVWEDGFKAGWIAAEEWRFGRQQTQPGANVLRKARSQRQRSKPKRKASAYSKRYGAAFKRIAPKNKKKGGGWKQGGFMRTQKAAHKAAKR